MLNVRSETRAFPEALRPVGEGSWEKETFDSWWARCASMMPNLHPLIAEQWVYRHYSYTSYSALPLDRLSWRFEHWSAAEITRAVLMPGNELEPAFDYEVFAGGDATATGQPFVEKGTWDYPIVVLHAEDGFTTWAGNYPDARFLLIEGHQRMRMLNAMHVLGKALRPKHTLLVLSLSSEER